MSDFVKIILVWVGIPVIGVVISCILGRLATKIHRNKENLMTNKEKSLNKKYGSYTDEDLNDWERLPTNIRVLTSSGFGAWLMRRDERKGNRDLINELEKIKADFEEMKGDGLPYNASDYLYGRYQALDIVDDILQDRIAELKGEQK